MSQKLTQAVGAPLERQVRPLVAVLAGTHEQFRLWANANQTERGVYCDVWPLFAGLEFTRMVEVGTFRLRKDALELWQRVAPMVRPNVQGEQHSAA